MTLRSRCAWLDRCRRTSVTKIDVGHSDPYALSNTDLPGGAYSEVSISKISVRMTRVRSAICRRLYATSAGSRQERTRSCGELAPVVIAREQVPVGVHRHDDRGVAESLLHDLGGQLEPAVYFPVDAPARLEMPERLQAGVSR